MNATDSPALRRLADILLDLNRESERGVLVAFSGGADSALLLDVAVELLGPERAAGAIAKSETLTDGEFERASALAAERRWPLEVVEYSELEIENYAANPSNRCFFCKNAMYERLGEIAARRGLGVIVCDGTNADDQGDHRPGMAAARARGVRSPLLEAGLGKDAIREEAKRRGLPNWNKPAGACLSSRVPYGMPVTREKIDQIAAAEEFLLSELGFSNCRARHHGDIVRLEFPPEEVARAGEPGIRAALVGRLKELGFAYICVDLEGYRSGSLNETLPGRLRPESRAADSER